jgi:hypothetical protein
METKISDLKTVMGKRVSQNQSPTGTAKLVKIIGTYCIFESLQSEYTRYPLDKVGVKYKVPTAWAWNAYFF